MSVVLIGFLFIWLVLVLVAYRFAKRVKEQDWGSFLAINLIPVVGSIFSIVVYSEQLEKVKDKEELR